MVPQDPITNIQSHEWEGEMVDNLATAGESKSSITDALSYSNDFSSYILVKIKE